MGVATAQSEVHRLTRVVLKDPRAAFRDDGTVEREWRELNYLAAPSMSRAIAEYERFVELLRGAGTDVVALPADDRTTLDSIYVRDAAVISDRGVVFGRMGKPQRDGEPAAQEERLRSAGVPVLGRIEAPGRLEGGDVLWLDRETLVVGRGYRTNDEGIRQLHALLGDGMRELIVVPLPHWRGPSDVMHLMSLISPVDEDLAVVYSPLLPVPFRERLIAGGIELVEVPDEEFDSMGTNVLALAPRRCLMLRGNPRTRTALERAGAEVIEYEGEEISVKGAGGPTCLTRPLVREMGRD
jgi:N-dimethylarginine dimethylaminohydrolase